MRDVRAIGIDVIARVEVIKVYRLEGVSDEQAARFAATVLTDLGETVTVNQRVDVGANYVVEVGYKPGVMNPEVSSLLKAGRDIGVELAAAGSSHEYHFFGADDVGDTALVRGIDKVLSRLLVNESVTHVVAEEPTTLVVSGERGSIETIPIRELTEQQLIELSQERQIYLDAIEMRAIQVEFRRMEREPTDGEVEMFGQSWSQHCCHKDFNANLIVDGVAKRPLMQRIREASEPHFEKTGVISAFVDNSGVVRFFDGYGICGKVETHNSPSAIEPYGGAMTGSGGVFRDIMATGKGAKVILSTDVFCFAPWDMDVANLPAGCLHPDYLLRKVVAGVRDYGNRMGIPTANGSVHFHRDFRAKPTVIVGAFGIIPEEDALKGEPEVSDLIVVIGGRTGRDGIHGATFSGVSMTAETGKVNKSAVQIGHAIEEKRMHDAELVARDRKHVRAKTDCGAGGLCCAITELAKRLGCRVYLERAPLKYPGLHGWEVWLSESQERDVLVVPPSCKDELMQVCRDHNVEATVLGEFTGDGMINVTWHGERLVEVACEFLHNGCPQRTLTATTVRQVLIEPLFAPPESPEEWKTAAFSVVSHPNVCSKEPIVRMYDHGVQGTCALPPYYGVNQDGPNDAVVLVPLLDKLYGLAVGHGLNPVLNRLDPYWGTTVAIAEAVSNVVAVGADPATIALIDNFIWPTPDEESLAALDASVDACTDACDKLEMPFVSGKDSLSSTYRSKGVVIKIPPVLCCTAFGKVHDVRKSVGSALRNADAPLVLVGQFDPRSMGGSAYYDTHGHLGRNVQQIDLAAARRTFFAVHRLIQADKVVACHDVSEGGVFTAVAEMAFGGHAGVSLTLDPFGDVRPDFALFSESVGCFVMQLNDCYEQYLEGVPCVRIGSTNGYSTITVTRGSDTVFQVNRNELKQAWKAPMQEVFR